MKKTSLVMLFFLCLYMKSQGQIEHPTFQIIKTGSKYSAEQIIAALTKADMCGNYYEAKNNDIVFDDSSVVRLFSKKDVPVNTIPPHCFVSDPVKPIKITWSILPSGQLMKGFRSTMKYPKKAAN